jgi:hypothetical protein
MKRFYLHLTLTGVGEIGPKSKYKNNIFVPERMFIKHNTNLGCMFGVANLPFLLLSFLLEG